MTTQEIADRLVELNRANEYKAAYAELYVDEPVSIENWGDRMEFAGMDAIIEKGKQWEANIEQMNEMVASDPLVADNTFAVTFYIDAVFKDMGHQKMTELAVYHVKDGKIYKEEFFG